MHAQMHRDDAATSRHDATTTRPASAAIACRQTCTIIGTPLMSASGFPGSRLACMRAGMTIRFLLMLIWLS
jgi:hypothetical protein